MVMVSKATNDEAFYLNHWDMQQFKEGLEVTAFINTDDQEKVAHVEQIVDQHLARLHSIRNIYSAVPPVEPRFDASYAPVVMAALKYNLYAKLSKFSGSEIPDGYKQFARQTGRAVRKLAKLASNSV